MCSLLWGERRVCFLTLLAGKLREYIYVRKYKYIFTHAAAARSLQSCLTLCDPIDSSSPGSPIPGILQARTLEWVAISFSNAGKWKVKVESLNRVWLLATPWTAAYQAPPPMGFSRQEYWSGVIFIHMWTQNVYPHTYTCFRNHGSTLTTPFLSSWNNFLPSPNPYIFLSFLLRYNWQIKL